MSVDVVGAADGVVLVNRSPDYSLYGLDARTGRTLWRHHREGRNLWPRSEGDGIVGVLETYWGYCAYPGEGFGLLNNGGYSDDEDRCKALFSWIPESWKPPGPD